jgi:hypothetical protein
VLIDVYKCYVPSLGGFKDLNPNIATEQYLEGRFRLSSGPSHHNAESLTEFDNESE